MRALYKKAAVLMKTSTSELKSLTRPNLQQSCSLAINLINSEKKAAISQSEAEHGGSSQNAGWGKNNYHK